MTRDKFHSFVGGTRLIARKLLSLKKKSSVMRVVLIRILNRNKNRVCTSHIQCVTICDICDGHKMSQFRICDLACFSGFDLVFEQNRIGHILVTNLTNGHIFKCDWYTPVSVSVF